MRAVNFSVRITVKVLEACNIQIFLMMRLQGLKVRKKKRKGRLSK